MGARGLKLLLQPGAATSKSLKVGAAHAEHAAREQGQGHAELACGRVCAPLVPHRAHAVLGCRLPCARRWPPGRAGARACSPPPPLPLQEYEPLNPQPQPAPLTPTHHPYLTSFNPRRHQTAPCLARRAVRCWTCRAAPTWAVTPWTCPPARCWRCCAPAAATRCAGERAALGCCPRTGCCKLGSPGLLQFPRLAGVGPGCQQAAWRRCDCAAPAPLLPACSVVIQLPPEAPLKVLQLDSCRQLHEVGRPASFQGHAHTCMHAQGRVHHAWGRSSCRCRSLRCLPATRRSCTAAALKHGCVAGPPPAGSSSWWPTNWRA